MKMTEVTADDIKMALVPVSKKSASVFKSVNILLKCIFNSAEDSKIIRYNPTRFLSTKGGGVPQKDRESLTDEQVEKLLDTIRELPPYVFVMIGLYAGLRREEILAFKWDCVFLDTDTPYLLVRRAWHTESNRPIIMTELKTKALEETLLFRTGWLNASEKPRQHPPRSMSSPIMTGVLCRIHSSRTSGGSSLSGRQNPGSPKRRSAGST
jgi:integrase